MGFEDHILNRIHKEKSQQRRAEGIEQEKNIIEDVYPRAKEMLSNPDYSVQAPEFMDLYGKDNVMADMERVKAKRDAFKALEQPWQKENARAAEVFEAIMLEHTELSNWLGQNASVLKTSLYDDYFNGTDLIAEWADEERESRVLGLAVDITFGERSVEKKLLGMRRRIDKGELSTIKYFKTADGTQRGERKQVPRVVIGVSKNIVKELATLWKQKDNKSLGQHPIQRAILDQIHAQLTTIQEYAVSRNQLPAADAYKRALAIIDTVRSDKKDVPLGKLAGDGVHQEILERTRELFRS